MIERLGTYTPVGQRGQILIELLLGSSTGLTEADRWPTLSLTADYLAAYAQHIIRVVNMRGPNNRTPKRDLVDQCGFVLNELLENGLKFSAFPERHPLTVQVTLTAEKIAFYVSHLIDAARRVKLEQFIKQLENTDAQALLLAQLEENAAGKDRPHSGIGLLSIVNDCEGEIGWRLERLAGEEGMTHLTTLVQLTLYESSSNKEGV